MSRGERSRTTIFTEDEIVIAMIRVEGGSRMHITFKPSGVSAYGRPKASAALLGRVKVETYLRILDRDPALTQRYPRLAEFVRGLPGQGPEGARAELDDEYPSDHSYLAIMHLIRLQDPELHDRVNRNYRLAGDALTRSLLNGEFDELVRAKSQRT